MTSLPPPTVSLSADEARRIALRAQGLLGAPDRRGGVRGVLRHLGAVQLDTISVLARSHELIPYARLGAVGRGTVERAYWSGHHAFEYWSHAACILPIEEWPHFAFRRRARRARGHRWHVLQDKERSTKAVLDRLRADGPLTSTELGGAKNGGEWFEWSETKIAVEWLLDTGEVVCCERRGWKRVYDLPERAVPDALLHDDLDDRECVRRLVALMRPVTGPGHPRRHRGLPPAGGRAGRRGDRGLRAGTGHGGGLGEAGVGGPCGPRDGPQGPPPHDAALPFDSLIWDRPRTERIFGFTHRLEAYVPKPKRIHGYFAMPLLAGGLLQGRVDPGREGKTLVARQLSLTSPKAARPMAQALREAAEWVGCDAVRVERAQSPQEAAAVVAELAVLPG